MGVLNSVFFPPRILSLLNSVGRWFLVPWLRISLIGLRSGHLFYNFYASASATHLSFKEYGLELSCLESTPYALVILQASESYL